jgi:hypothetical protein
VFGCYVPKQIRYAPLRMNEIPEIVELSRTSVMFKLFHTHDGSQDQHQHQHTDELCMLCRCPEACSDNRSVCKANTSMISACNVNECPAAITKYIYQLCMPCKCPTTCFDSGPCTPLCACYASFPGQGWSGCDHKSRCGHESNNC